MLSGIPSAWKLTCLIGCRKVKHEIERTLNSGLNLLKLSLKRFLLASTSVVCHYYSRRMIFTRERTSRLHPLYPWIVLCLCLCARSDSTMILVSSHFVYHSSFCSLSQNWRRSCKQACLLCTLKRKQSWRNEFFCIDLSEGNSKVAACFYRVIESNIYHNK